jgi:mono/diheme cytochrome c family protein
MSTPSHQDPRLDQAAVTDESLLAAHEKLLGKQPDEKGHYSLTPLVLLFVFSGLIFWAGTYLNRYSGVFNAGIFNENAHPSTGAPAGPAPENPLVEGKAAYAQVCVQCHMPTGLGLPGSFPPLVKSEWVTGSEDRLIRIVLYGLKGPITVNGATYNAAAMPPFRKGTAYNWSDRKVAAVLTYIRQEWGNTAGPISTEKVAEIRTQVGERPEWTADELLKLP